MSRLHNWERTFLSLVVGRGLTVILMLLSGTQPACALSTVTQVTSTNAQRFASLVSITVVKEGNDHLRFDVKFSPSGMADSESISGQLEVKAGKELVVRSALSGGRPAEWPKISGRTGPKPLHFSFTIKREHLSGSTFGITQNQPDYSRMDNYWFLLKDFVDDP